mmetsp:Transcript_50889/g.99561  ORF Transcript_50889/g.99561 Transcript_50889/m.99561 type:complete len:193 (+) Transcript_50889:25-603(+)
MRMATQAEMLKPGEEGETLRELHLKVDMRFGSIKVVPKSDEGNDANFPRNLHNAAELFLRVGMVDPAERLREKTAAMLDLYADNPDGKTGLRIGRGVVCWSCGHCGVPKSGGDAKEKTPPGPCGNCGEVEQINWLRISLNKGENLPWIEAAPLSPKEAAKKKKAADAAKRAEIEANVKKALLERISSQIAES